MIKWFELARAKDLSWGLMLSLDLVPTEPSWYKQKAQGFSGTLTKNPEDL
jgi:hypothetical protein